MHLLTEEEGALAVKAARSIVEAAAQHADIPSPEFPETFSENRGVFVTLTKSGELRGCIGYPYPVLSLRSALSEAAVSAATRDPRFSPVRGAELSDIRVEVTILTPPEILSCPAEERPSCITVGRHGLIAAAFGISGLLLPQVAEEYGWDAEEFLNQTCIKAGLSPQEWKNEECIIQTFEGQIFTENEHGSNI